MMYINNSFKNVMYSPYAFVLIIILNVSTLLNAQVPVLVKDINPGSPSSSPQYLTNFDGKLYFSAKNTTGLWMTDGTEQGTVQSEGDTRLSNDFVTNLTVLNRQLFFNTNNNPSWWKTTGGENQAVNLFNNFHFIKGVSYESSEMSMMFLVFAGKDYNVSSSAINLYCSNGGGDFLDVFGNLNSDSNGPSPMGFKKVNSKLIFSAVETDTGRELYSTDATNGSTFLIKDINPGIADGLSDASGLEDSVVIGNKLCFPALSNAPSGNKLWCTDGTTAGTFALYDDQGVLNSTQTDYDSPQYLTVFNNYLYFFAYSGNSNRLQLWKSSTYSRDPSIPIHPTQVTFNSNLFKGINNNECGGNLKPIVVDNLMFFPRASNNKGCELWRSDGTTDGTFMLKDINKGLDDSMPMPMAVFNGELYFSAFDKDTGTELWHTNGKSFGTKIVSDLNPGAAGSIINDQMIIYNGAPYYIADDGTHGQELYKITFPVQDFLFSSGFE